MTTGEIVFSGPLLAALPIAFAAGLLAFLSPCVLPLIPGYLAYIGGFAITDNPTRSDRARVLVGMIGFVIGFGAVFLSLSVLFGTLGLFVLPWLDAIIRVAGVLLIVLGFVFMGGFTALQRDILPHWRTRAGVWGAPLLGVTFALGWVPCVGPTLVAVQALALDTGDPARAALLGVAYWLGLAVPFVLVALLLGRIAPALDWVKRHIRTINIAGGVILALIGVTMLAGLWRPFLSWVGVIVSDFIPAL